MKHVVNEVSHNFENDISNLGELILLKELLLFLVLDEGFMFTKCVASFGLYKLFCTLHLALRLIQRSRGLDQDFSTLSVRVEARILIPRSAELLHFLFPLLFVSSRYVILPYHR